MKRFSLFAVVSLCAVGIVWGARVLSAPNAGDAIVFEREPNLARVSAEAFTATDTDGDGLKDWEENLWKTDIANPDTDGDGTPDGREVEEGRDPSVPGPDDAYRSRVTVVEQTASRETPDGEKNLTQRLGEIYGAAYTILEERGELSATTRERLYEIFIENIQQTDAFKDKRIVYLEQDLTVAKTPEEIKNYKRALTDISRRYETKYRENPLVVLEEALSRQAVSDRRNELLGLSEAYGELARELSLVAVPADILETHLSLINAYESIRVAVKDMSYADTDPLRGLVGISNYQENIATVLSLTTVLNSFLLEI